MQESASFAGPSRPWRSGRVIEAGWYAIVARLLSAASARRAYPACKGWTDRTAGLVLWVRLAPCMDRARGLNGSWQCSSW
jgi:hypothetical protein